MCFLIFEYCEKFGWRGSKIYLIKIYHFPYIPINMRSVFIYMLTDIKVTINIT